MKIVLTHILFLTLITSVFAQEKKNRIKPIQSLEVRLGYSQFKEKNLHGKLFNGMDYSVGYNVARDRKNFSKFSLSIGNSHLKTNIEKGFSSNNFSLNIDYSYLFKTFDRNKRKLHTGLGAMGGYNISYFWVWDDSHLYWANYLGIYLHQTANFETSKNQKIYGSVSISPFMVVTRPEIQRNYKMDDLSFGGTLNNLHRDPKFSFLSQSMDLICTIEDQFERKKKIYPHLNYTFRYQKLSTKSSNSRQSIQHLIGLKFDL